MAEPMSLKQMRPYLGREGTIIFNNFQVKVKVIDVRSSGKNMVEYLVSPIAGSGESWVSSSMIELDPDPNGPTLVESVEKGAA